MRNTLMTLLCLLAFAAGISAGPQSPATELPRLRSFFGVSHRGCPVFYQFRLCKRTYVIRDDAIKNYHFVANSGFFFHTYLEKSSVNFTFQRLSKLRLFAIM